MVCFIVRPLPKTMEYKSYSQSVLSSSSRDTTEDRPKFSLHSNAILRCELVEIRRSVGGKEQTVPLCIYMWAGVGSAKGTVLINLLSFRITKYLFHRIQRRLWHYLLGQSSNLICIEFVIEHLSGPKLLLSTEISNLSPDCVVGRRLFSLIFALAVEY